MLNMASRCVLDRSASYGVPPGRRLVADLPAVRSEDHGGHLLNGERE